MTFCYFYRHNIIEDTMCFASAIFQTLKNKDVLFSGYLMKFIFCKIRRNQIFLTAAVLAFLPYCEPAQTDPPEYFIPGFSIWMNGKQKPSVECENTSGLVICIPPGFREK